MNVNCKYNCKKIDLTELFPNKPDAFAYLLENVFSKEECKNMIDRTEQIGYSPALVGGDQHRDTSNRNNWRCIIDDPVLAAQIFERIKDHLPSVWLNQPLDSLNYRLRFLKYLENEYFKSHNDGIYVNDTETKCTYITMHLYLNDVDPQLNGETSFTTERINYATGEIKTKASKKVHINPVAGNILLFEHHLLHEGSELFGGVKYTVRSDIFYKIPPNVKISRKSRWGNPLNLFKQYTYNKKCS